MKNWYYWKYLMVTSDAVNHAQIYSSSHKQKTPLLGKALVKSYFFGWGLFQQHHFPGFIKTSTFDLNKIKTAWLMASIPFDAVIPCK